MVTARVILLFRDLYYFIDVISSSVGRDSSCGIATRYELDRPGIESRWGRDFPQQSRPARVSTQPYIQWEPGLSRGIKWPGRDVDHPPPSSVDVQERVELYIYSLFGSSWSVLFRNFTSGPQTYI
jgi:hypothetical protein